MPAIYDSITISIPVEVDADQAAGIPSYRDTIFMSYGEFKGLTAAQVKALAKARYDAWKDQILHPPPPEPVDPVGAQTAARAAMDQAMEALKQAKEAFDATTE